MIQKSMMISTISAPYCVHLFLSDDSRCGSGRWRDQACISQSTKHTIGTSRLPDFDMLFALLVKFECDFCMKGGMNSVS